MDTRRDIALVEPHIKANQVAAEREHPMHNRKARRKAAAIARRETKQIMKAKKVLGSNARYTGA